MTKTVAAELKEVTGVEQKPGEAQDAFLVRLAKKANDLQDDEWQALSHDAQVWVNAGLDAVEAKKVPPVPAGMEAAQGDAPAPKKGKKGDKAEPVKGKKEAKAEPKKADKKAKPLEGRGPKGKFAKTDKIKVLVKENPFREGCKAHTRFGSIKTGMTIEEAVAAGAPRSHIRWAETLGHLEIGG